MRKNSLDTVLRLHIRHRPGQLARVATAVAEEGGLIGDVSTVGVHEDVTIRDITVETQDEVHLQRILAAVRKVPGLELLSVTDRVFECHRGGKVHMQSRVDLKSFMDLRYVYTPGVARVCSAIHKNPELAFEYTGISNSVGIFSNGTRVLGLGDIGPTAALPVMEGKSVLYQRFVGISAIPLVVDTKDADEFIETVVRLAPSFGAIHLEDIRVPDCFKIEDTLKKRLKKPVMHDDQHGTATVALAAVINAARMTGLDLAKAKVGQIGLGAAGSAIARLMLAYGVKDMSVTDVSNEAMATLVKEGARATDLEGIMRNCDIVVAATGRRGLIPVSMVRKGQVIFALSNPDAEIEPQDALNAGAAFASDGRSVNNALSYPSLFKAALETRSSSITREMMLTAAKTIASFAVDDEVVPDVLRPGVHEAVTAAVADTARRQGLAGTASP